MRRTMIALAALLPAMPAQAEVKAADTNGLAVRQVVTIAAPPEKVYAALLTPGRWWMSEHSWSGDAANMTLEPRAGGCFCEKMPKAGGEAKHGEVVFILPNKAVRLRAELGPFMTMGVSGALSWELKPVEGGTELTQSYAVGGHVPGGFQALAPIVDGVMAGQTARLKAFVEKK